MQITTKRIKQIIAEEMRKLDESFGRHMAGETERTAAGMQDTEAGQKWLEVSGMIYKVAREDLDMLLTAIRGLPMNAKEAIRQELKMAEEPSYDYDANDDQNRQMTADSAEDRAYNRYDSNYPESKYRYQESRKKRNK